MTFRKWVFFCMALFTKPIILTNIYYNGRRGLGLKKLETFCGRRWMRAGSHSAAGREKVGRNNISLNQIGTFWDSLLILKSKANYPDQNWSSKCKHRLGCIYLGAEFSSSDLSHILLGACRNGCRVKGGSIQMKISISPYVLSMHSLTRMKFVGAPQSWSAQM